MSYFESNFLFNFEYGGILKDNEDLHFSVDIDHLTPFREASDQAEQNLYYTLHKMCKLTKDIDDRVTLLSLNEGDVKFVHEIYQENKLEIKPWHCHFLCRRISDIIYVFPLNR